jgi:transcriptional regulator with XRE-family HTH domain
MASTEPHKNELERGRSSIANRVRELRKARRWTQAELAGRLGISQGRVSELERGDGSFTAEQLLLLLKLFNVGVSEFELRPHDRTSEISKVLARLGAPHLQERADVLPSERIEEVTAAVREALSEASPRLIAAIAPVLVSNIDHVNLTKLLASLVDAGLGRRLCWLVENTLVAVRSVASAELDHRWALRYRRAEVILETFLDFAFNSQPSLPNQAPDLLDAEIRTAKTREAVRSSSSDISRRWGIITRLQPGDFVRALEAARAAR